VQRNLAHEIVTQLASRGTKAAPTLLSGDEDEWEYLCCDGVWRACELVHDPEDQGTYETIRAGDGEHSVPRENVRKKPR
jgi:hypothetical protein